eukprot:6339647-Heterocapsa_arctica.AAC.1
MCSDIANSIKKLNPNIASPTDEYMKAMEHLYKYIKGTQDEVLVLDNNKVSDANGAARLSRR